MRDETGPQRAERRRRSGSEMRSLMQRFAALPPQIKVRVDSQSIAYKCLYCARTGPDNLKLNDPKAHGERCLWRQTLEWLVGHPIGGGAIPRDRVEVDR